MRRLGTYGGRPYITAKPLRGLGQLPARVHIRTLRGLGDTATAVSDLTSTPPTIIDTATGNVYDAQGNLVARGQAAMPTQGSAAPSPGMFSSALTQAQVPLDPLSYVSPQSAIAAGLDPQTVMRAWVSKIATFSTPTLAIAAGIPAGIVTHLWARSREVPPAPPKGWLEQYTFGIENSKWLFGAGLGLLLVAMYEPKGRE